jgi:hypothetical protein
MAAMTDSRQIVVDADVQAIRDLLEQLRRGPASA